MPITRRDVLEGAAWAAASVVVAGSTARAQERSSHEIFEAYVRMRGSLDDRIVYERVAGWTYATVPGERGRVLWCLDGLSVSRFRRVSSEQYSRRTRYLGALRDPQTQEIMRTFVNPYTAERCDVPLSKYGPSTIDLKPGRQPTQLGEWVYFTDHVVSTAASALQPDFDIVTFGARAAEAFDPRLAYAHSTQAFSATERWREWMKMGERPGGLFWHVVGAKVDRKDVPADLWALARSEWGDQIEDL